MACADDAFALNALLSHPANVCEALRVPIDMFAGIASELAYGQHLIREARPAGFLSGPSSRRHCFTIENKSYRELIARGLALIRLALPQVASSVAPARAHMARMSAATSRRLPVAAAL
jgi:hypothetical protein